MNISSAKSFGMGALLVFAGALFTGCGPAKQGAGESAAPVAATPAPATLGTPEAPREVTVEVGDSMKFSVTRIEAQAGETLRLVLVNSGSAPKEAMGHNLVLLKAGVDANAYATAALKAKATDYVPEERAGEVLAHTKLLGGKSKDAVVFTVPAELGEYVYICTFPAHLQLGMKGVLVVK
ncbi:MAG: plastocyanin/azurin family copper-binding protein [Opitutaceae bacterium]|jgi:azurin|nr:plastocyanin/azurin family copper-binding protein [Opitutaceae bacterium]